MAISNGYCSLADVKASLRITDNVDDSLLELAVESASREIDSACERVFYPTATTRIYAPDNDFVCNIDDIVSLTTLKTSSNADGTFDTTWAATDYQLEPLNGIAGGILTSQNIIRAVGSYTFPVAGTYAAPVQGSYAIPANGATATVQVVGTFGFSAAPTAVKQATVILASRIFKRNDSPLGIAGFGDMGAIRVSRLDSDVEALIAPYKKMRFA